jgi:hypothetical protein
LKGLDVQPHQSKIKFFVTKGTHIQFNYIFFLWKKHVQILQFFDYLCNLSLPRKQWSFLKTICAEYGSTKWEFCTFLLESFATHCKNVSTNVCSSGFKACFCKPTFSLIASKIFDFAPKQAFFDYIVNIFSGKAWALKKLK